MREDVFGSGYGFRILSFGGLPIWITPGFGKIYRPEEKQFEQVFMFMTAAGWQDGSPVAISFIFFPISHPLWA
jgi:hypothetical protein